MRINGKIVTDDQRKAAVRKLGITDHETLSHLYVSTPGVGWWDMGGHPLDVKRYQDCDSRALTVAYNLCDRLPNRGPAKDLLAAIDAIASANHVKDDYNKRAARTAREAWRKFWKAILNA